MSIYDVPYTPISLSIKNIRQTLNIKVAELGNLIDTKEISLYKWEHEKRCPNFEIVLRLSFLTELSIDELSGMKSYNIDDIKQNVVDVKELIPLIKHCQRKFGYNLFALRLSKNMSQPKLGKEIGVVHDTVRAWENGKIPHIDKLIKLAKYFDVSIEELVGLETLDL